MANVEIYTKETCPYCHRAKALLSSKGVSFQELPIDGNAAKREEMIDLDTASSQLADDVYEVVLRVTVTASLGEETAFLCEVQQGGIFSIAGIEGTQMAHCLGAYCPNILFPYARECITSMVSRGTFPQLNLAPVNFDALFMNYLQQQAGEGTEEHQDA